MSRGRCCVCVAHLITPIGAASRSPGLLEGEPRPRSARCCKRSRIGRRCAGPTSKTTWWDRRRTDDATGEPQPRRDDSGRRGPRALISGLDSNQISLIRSIPPWNRSRSRRSSFMCRTMALSRRAHDVQRISRTVEVSGRPLTVAIDHDPSPRRRWVILHGRLVDELTGQPPGVSPVVTTTTPGLQAFATADGAFGVAGVASAIVPMFVPPIRPPSSISPSRSPCARRATFRSRSSGTWRCPWCRPPSWTRASLRWLWATSRCTASQS